jgi:hypothetical protein
MDRPNRIHVTLGGRDMEVLRWLAAERVQIPVNLASRLLSDAIQTALREPGVDDAYRTWLAGASCEEVVQADIVTAMQVPGVPLVLSGREQWASAEARRAASYLVGVSAWLEDRRDLSIKGPAPRLYKWHSEELNTGTIGDALTAIGGADGVTNRLGTLNGVQSVSDKRQISDTPTPAATPGRARRAGHA